MPDGGDLEGGRVFQVLLDGALLGGADDGGLILGRKSSGS
jgi:hypothetical protein